MTISQSFIKFLEAQGYGVFGQDLYLYRVPNSLKTKTNLFWVVPNSGSVIQKNKTNEKIKSHQFLVYYRSNSAREVDEKLSQLEETLNCMTCVQLEGYQTLDVSATQFSSDIDPDSENRMVGFIQVTIQTYKSC